MENIETRKLEILEKLKTFGLFSTKEREEAIVEIGDVFVAEWEQGIVVDEEYIKHTLFHWTPFINVDLLEGVCTYTFEAIKDLQCCGVEPKTVGELKQQMLDKGISIIGFNKNNVFIAHWGNCGKQESVELAREELSVLMMTIDGYPS